MNERRLCIQHPQLAALSDKERTRLLRRADSRIFRNWRFWLVSAIAPSPLLLTGLVMAAIVPKLPWDDALSADAVWWAKFTAILIPTSAVSAGWLFVVFWVNRRLTRAAILAELAAMEHEDQNDSDSV